MNSQQARCRESRVTQVMLRLVRQRPSPQVPQPEAEPSCPGNTNATEAAATPDGCSRQWQGARGSVPGHWVPFPGPLQLQKDRAMPGPGLYNKQVQTLMLPQTPVLPLHVGHTHLQHGLI